jgi:hypothetical protein
METAEARRDAAEPAIALAFPEGRTRFNTAETMRMIGMPSGSKILFQELVIDTRVDSEVIGNSRTYTRDAVARLAQAYARSKRAAAGKAASQPARAKGNRRSRSASVV